MWTKAMRTLEKKEEKEMKRRRKANSKENGVKMKKWKGIIGDGKEEQVMKC
jgi:predicted phosphoribosyltransferase